MKTARNGLLILFVLALVGSASVATAHHPEITASTDCVKSDGSWDVCYTATAWMGGGTERENPRIEIYFVYDNGDVDLVDVGAFELSNDYAFSGCATVAAGRQSVRVQALAAAEWANGYPAGDWTEICLDLPPEPCDESGACWLTGGGPKFMPLIQGPAGANGPRHNWGGNVYPSCDPRPGDGGSWNHIAHSDKLHFHATDINVVRCGNVDGIEPGSESPVTPYNFIEFRGFGWLKGIKGNKVDHGTVYFFARCEDRNEPGSRGAKDGADVDRYFIHVFADQNDPLGSTLLLLDLDGDASTVDPVTITGGNMQMHCGCDEPPSPEFGTFTR